MKKIFSATEYTKEDYEVARDNYSDALYNLRDALSDIVEYYPIICEYLAVEDYGEFYAECSEWLNKINNRFMF